MNFLEKLSVLMKEHNLNNNTLAKSSGIPYTTIDALFKKGYEGVRMSTVKKLASYFHVSLDYLMDDTIDDPHYGKTDTERLGEIMDDEAQKLDQFLSKSDSLGDFTKDELTQYYLERLMTIKKLNLSDNTEGIIELAEMFADYITDRRIEQKRIREENEARYNAERESQLIGYFRCMNDSGQNFVIDFLEAMSVMDKYRKEK